MSENWHEERSRLLDLLKSVEDGKTTQFNDPATGELRRANPDNVGRLKGRLALLNFRLD